MTNEILEFNNFISTLLLFSVYLPVRCHSNVASDASLHVSET